MAPRKSELQSAVLSYARKAARETKPLAPAPPTPPPAPADERLTQSKRSRIVAALKRLHPMD